MRPLNYFWVLNCLSKVKCCSSIRHITGNLPRDFSFFMQDFFGQEPEGLAEVSVSGGADSMYARWLERYGKEWEEFSGQVKHRALFFPPCVQIDTCREAVGIILNNKFQNPVIKP